MSKKGFSVEEKRSRLLDLFHETILDILSQKDFYKLADLEKLAPKSKGITMQTVKETLQSLVDDNLVCHDKIGAGNYYWSFPSAAGSNMNKELAKRTEVVNSIKSNLESMNSEITSLTEGRKETYDRMNLLQQVDQAQNRLKGFETELQMYTSCDPIHFERKEKAIIGLQDSALEWTERVSCALAFVSSKFGSDARDGIKAQLELGDDFEELSFEKRVI